MTILPPEFEIRCDEDAISLLRHGTAELEWIIRWDEITEIAAWKRDLFAIDLICLGFRWAGSEIYKEVDEHMSGWTQLMAALEQRFGLAVRSWWRDVAFPPYAEQHCVVWKSS